MTEKKMFKVEAEESGLRVDKYLSDQLPEISRSYLQKIIKDGQVLANDKPVKANYKVSMGDAIELEIPEAVEPEIEPENIPLEILYEDADVILINKPKGMVVHPSAGHYSGTLVNGLMYHCKDELSGINGVMRPGIVHRIDMDTTGVIIACKNDKSHNSIAEQLKEHSITRRYRAIVCGNIKEDEGTVDKPIGRDPSNRLRNAVTDLNSKNAVTHYKVLERFGRFTLIEAQLETGRTHQIRVHMAYLKHPLLGDELYGPVKSKEGSKLGAKRQMLHAGILGFVHPSTGEYMEFESSLPDDFESVLKKLR